MTKLWVDSRFVPVTLIFPVQQKIVRHKTVAVDWYSALVVEITGESKQSKFQEIRGNEKLLQSYPIWTILDAALMEWLKTVTVTGTSKWKWFQWVMKRHNFAGGPETHGSKFHRAWWSTGNRKPRRTHRGHPMAGRMGSDTITLRTVPVITIVELNGVKAIALKWSLPGAYNSLLKVTF